MRNLTTQVIRQGRIKTTRAKAEAPLGEDGDLASKTSTAAGGRVCTLPGLALEHNTCSEVVVVS